MYRPVFDPLCPAGISATAKAPEVPTHAESDLPYGNGTFQLRFLVSLTITLGTYSLHYESFRITAGVMDHWCRRPDSFANLTVLQWKQLAIPLDERGEFSRCTVREPPDADNATSVVPCTSWEYDLDQFGNNIVSEWNLVCGRRWLIEVARLVYFSTCIVSLLLFGVLADQVGRKTVVFITIPVVLISGVGSTVPNDFQFFVAVRAIVAASTSALVPPMLALFYEITPASRIPVYIIVASLSSVVMPLPLSFFTQPFRAGWVTQQFMLMVPTFLLVLLYYGIDESPAWLLAKGKAKEAERVALRAANLNKASLQLCREMLGQQKLEAQADSKGAYENTGLCSSHLRARIVLLAFMCTAISYAYDTFAINDGVYISGAAAAIGYIFQNETMMQNCLVIFMRASGSICFTSFVSQAAGAYPIMTHSRGAAWNLAFSRIGDTLGQTSTALLEGRHTDLRLAVAAALLALFVIGAQGLPYEHDWVLQGSSTCGPQSSARCGVDVKRAMQDTLVPLPKEPVKRRDTKTSDRVSLAPKQYSTYSIQRSHTPSLQ
ncbi:solute carrier family 22 member 7-like [Amblyomma americanum]